MQYFSAARQKVIDEGVDAGDKFSLCPQRRKTRRKCFKGFSLEQITLGEMSLENGGKGKPMGTDSRF